MVTSYNQRDWDRCWERITRPPASDVELIDETLELGAMVEPFGFDSIWSTEHYGSAYSMQANPLQWLAYWAGRTERVDVGSAVIVAPWWQPVKLAHEIAMLDLLLEGRTFHIGIGRGVSAHEYAGSASPGRSPGPIQGDDRILRLADENERTPHYQGEIYHIPPFTVSSLGSPQGPALRQCQSGVQHPGLDGGGRRARFGQLFVAEETIDQDAESGRPSSTPSGPPRASSPTSPR